jgi:hypothetical protein
LKLSTILVGIGGAVVGIGLLGQRLGGMLKSGVEQAGSAILGVNVALSDVSVSPFTGKVSLTGLTVGNPQGFSDAPLFTANLISCRAEVATLWTSDIHLYEVALDGAALTYEIGIGGSNLNALAANLGGGGGKSATLLRIDSLNLTNLTANVGALGFTKGVKIPDIALSNVGDSSGKGLPPEQVLALIVRKVIAGVV